jgi:hypothetical protein
VKVAGSGVWEKRGGDICLSGLKKIKKGRKRMKFLSPKFKFFFKNIFFYPEHKNV